MMETEYRRHFTPAFARRVKDAIELNRSEKGDVYHHPSEGRMVRKCLDLTCPKPLHGAKSDHPSRSSSAERWLEAYLIRQARSNGWILELADRKLRFIYSQLKYRAAGTKKARPLDLLLWDVETHRLVILELKVGRRLKESEGELEDYVARMSSISHEFVEVFGLPEVAGVEGYIVWPHNARSDTLRRHDLGSYGVIEFDGIPQPWNRFREIGENLKIDFRPVKHPQVHISKAGK